MVAACRGTVRNGVVELDEGALPEGAVVEVRLLDEKAAREAAYQRLAARRAANARFRVNMQEMIEEDKRHREGDAERWMPSTFRDYAARRPAKA